MPDLSAIIDLIKNMGAILAIVFYGAIVVWTYKDARKRTEDPIIVASFTAIGMIPIVGVFVYMLLRPSEYLADVRERELEIRMLERQLGRQERCPYCKSHIEGEYLSCPVCATKLRQACVGCDKPLDPRWVMCPFCETEVPGRGRTSPTPGGPGRGARPRTAPESGESTRRGGSGSGSGAAPRRERAPRDGGRGGSGGSRAPKRDEPRTRLDRSDEPTGRERGGDERPASRPAAKPSTKRAPAADDSPSGTGDIQTEPFGPGARV